MPKGIFTRKVREIVNVVGPSVAYVKLTQGQYSRIDSDDAEKFGSLSWNALWNPKTDSFYAVGNKLRDEAGKRGVRLLHREVMSAQTGILIDHRDGDTLNNCKYNLRIATRSENARNRVVLCRSNTSGFKGVRWHATSHKWEARISISGKSIYLGLHDTAEAASDAYRNAATKYHGEFAKV